MRGHVSPGQVLCYNEDAVRGYITGNEYTRALELLLQHFQDAIVRYCLCHTLDIDQAQELAQDTFLAALEAMPRFRGQSSLKTWLYSIAIHKCLAAGRNGGRRGSLTRNYWRLIRQGAHCEPLPRPEEAWRQSSERQRVWQALQALQVPDRELVVLRYLEDLTYDEIAQILQISKRTVERRLPVARAKFRQAYERRQSSAMVHRHTVNAPLHQGSYRSSG